MVYPNWLDKYPRVQALLQQPGEVLDYPEAEEAVDEVTGHGRAVNTVSGLPKVRPALEGGMGDPDEWVTGGRVQSDGDQWAIVTADEASGDDAPVSLHEEE